MIDFNYVTFEVYYGSFGRSTKNITLYRKDNLFGLWPQHESFYDEYSSHVLLTAEEALTDLIGRYPADKDLFPGIIQKLESSSRLALPWAEYATELLGLGLPAIDAEQFPWNDQRALAALLQEQLDFPIEKFPWDTWGHLVFLTNRIDLCTHIPHQYYKEVEIYYDRGGYHCDCSRITKAEFDMLVDEGHCIRESTFADDRNWPLQECCGMPIYNFSVVFIRNR